MGDGKIFVGGLCRVTTDDSLTKYFSHWGVIKDVTIPKTPEQESRGFAFITFADPNAALNAISYSGGYHVIDGKQAEVKPCADRRSQYGSPAATGSPQGELDPKKIFVGGLPPEATKETLTEAFSQYGPVTHAIAMIDTITGRPKGFGFVTFDNAETTDLVVSQHYVDVLGKKVEVKKAIMMRPFSANSGAPRPRGGFRHPSPYPRYGGDGYGYQPRGPRPNYRLPAAPPQQYPPPAAPQWTGYEYAQYGYPADAYSVRQPNGQESTATAVSYGYAQYGYAQPVPGYPQQYAEAYTSQDPAVAQYTDPSAGQAKPPNGVPHYSTYGKPPTISGYPVTNIPLPEGTPAAKPTTYAAQPYSSGTYGHAAVDGNIATPTEVPGSDPGKIGFSAGRPVVAQPYHPYRR